MLVSAIGIIGRRLLFRCLLPFELETEVDKRLLVFSTRRNGERERILLVYGWRCEKLNYSHACFRILNPRTRQVVSIKFLKRDKWNDFQWNLDVSDEELVIWKLKIIEWNVRKQEEPVSQYRGNDPESNLKWSKQNQ